MKLIKRASVFIVSCTAIFMVMAAVLKSGDDSLSVFLENPSELTVYDEESLLPVGSCSIIIINGNESYKTDSKGKVSIKSGDTSLIAYKEGYAPYLLLHHDFKEDCKIFLKRDGDSSFSAKVDENYAKKVIENFLNSKLQ